MIPGNGFQYQNLGSGQDVTEEFFKTHNLLRKIFLERIVEEAPELVDPNIRLEFINYGDTQQVYVLTANGKQWSILGGVNVETKEAKIGDEYYKEYGFYFDLETVTGRK